MFAIITEEFVATFHRTVGATLVKTISNTLEITVAHLVANAEPSFGHRAPRSWETEPENV